MPPVHCRWRAIRDPTICEPATPNRLPPFTVSIFNYIGEVLGDHFRAPITAPDKDVMHVQRRVGKVSRYLSFLGAPSLASWPPSDRRDWCASSLAGKRDVRSVLRVESVEETCDWLRKTNRIITRALISVDLACVVCIALTHTTAFGTHISGVLNKRPSS